ncbi:hypothetical protein KC686_03425, partial [Candidatus Woesebacteria bacterium]|nr:hypothetical protein [Candidatus Woesebacteria bacterium]
MVIQKQAIFIFLSLLLVFLCTTWSIISQDGMFYTHDFVHGARIVEMQRAVLAGHIPARWSQNFNYGYGMPLFSFYAPLPYLVGALCTLLGASLTTAVKALFIIPSLVTLLGSYLLGRRLFGAAGGVLTAAFITLAPYRAVNLFVRGAVAESWGMMTIPWLLYGLLRIYDNTKDGIGYVIFATSFITLLLSHNLMSLMVIVFAPVMLLALLTP